MLRGRQSCQRRKSFFFAENLESKTSNPNLKEEKARQKCDIYSFSIISHEVIFEQGPYWTGPYNSGKFSN